MPSAPSSATNAAEGGPRLGDNLTTTKPALSAATFAPLIEALGPFEKQPHLAAAVSGGRDSLALMHLLAGWCRTRGGQLTILTVDHGLRAEAAAEARQVGIWAAALGLPHVVLDWQGAKPVTGIQAAARAARYALLSAWCREANVLHLALGHQADDQRETVAMRKARNEDGVLGLAGMSAIASRDGVRLLRPLLGVQRDAITACLRAIGQDWLEDPSNSAEQFERVRWRQGSLGDLPQLSKIWDAGRRRQELEGAAADLLLRGAEIAVAGYALLDLATLAAAEPALRSLAVGALITSVGGGDYRPSSAAIDRDLSAAMVGETRSLGHCLLAPWRARLLICKEGRAAQPGLWLRDAGPHRWDGRFTITLDAPADPVEISALGEAGLREIEGSARFLKDIPAPARPSLPALRDATGRLIRVPFTDFDPFGKGMAVTCRFLPEKSATSIGFTVAPAVPHTI